ncbi:biotin synthase BioB [Myxococcota bacterium]|nr:biotin synthase BioB [Myxococcota bacterium]
MGEVRVFERYSGLAERALRGEAPSREDARWILDGEDVALLPLLHAAYLPRERAFGRRVQVQMLNNVQNGLCPEDCGYCPQARDSAAAIRKYPMKPRAEILAEAERAAQAGATRYCMVLSGRGPSLERTHELADIVREVKARFPIGVCVSVGLVDEEKARILADAGLDRLNHNLNTSERRYPEICSTHTWADRVRTLTAAKKSGIASCSGFILGMGETTDDVLDVAFTLRELEVPSIPVNFLVPIDGNPVFDDGTLTPERCLRALALMRLVNPSAEIRAAGGREGHLRTLGPLLFWPANSLFVEGYLTTRGDAVEETYRMIADAGFEVDGNPLYDERRAADARAFRLAGADGQILKPDIAAPTRRVAKLPAHP